MLTDYPIRPRCCNGCSLRGSSRFPDPINLSLFRSTPQAQDPGMVPFTPAQAYWKQRRFLADNRDRILQLCRAVDRPGDLFPFQWAQLMACAAEFSPDLILELGRGKGNSTCAFTEAAHWLGAGRCQVWSLCLTADWERETLPRVRQVVPEAWFSPLHAVQGDILEFDFTSILAGARRVLIFWDAHGFDVAECILGTILPQIADLPHAVLMHDLLDTRYWPRPDAYGEARLWKGESSTDFTFKLGHIETHVAQFAPVLDFTTRNHVSLESADHSYHTELSSDPSKVEEMRRLLGEELFSLRAAWFWFSLNEVAGPYTFPRVDPSAPSYELRYGQLQQENGRLAQQTGQLQQQLAQVQQENGRLAQQIGQLQQQLAQVRTEHAQVEQQLHTGRQTERQQPELQQRIRDLEGQLALSQARVQELCRSRWRRLGRRLGIARKASWERTGSGR